MPDVQADLLRLLELAHPGRPQADLLAMIEATPNARAVEKPAQRRVGSRPRSSASMERRRSWAASGLLPPRLACRFTLAEQAVLAVVAEQVSTPVELPAGGKFQTCELPMDAIAAKAGVCRSTVRNALREAKRLGFIAIEERRLSAWRNAPNRVTILSPEWLSWLKMRSQKVSPRLGEKGGGRKSVSPTNTKIQKRGFRNEEAAQAPGQTSKAGPPQAGPRPDSASGRGLQARPGLDGGSTRAGLPGVQWRGMPGCVARRG